MCTHQNRLNEAILMRTHNIPSCYRKSKKSYASRPGAIINSYWLGLPLSRANIHGRKGVRANEVRQYEGACLISFTNFEYALSSYLLNCCSQLKLQLLFQHKERKLDTRHLCCFSVRSLTNIHVESLVRRS